MPNKLLIQFCTKNVRHKCCWWDRPFVEANPTYLVPRGPLLFQTFKNTRNVMLSVLNLSPLSLILSYLLLLSPLSFPFLLSILFFFPCFFSSIDLFSAFIHFNSVFSSPVLTFLSLTFLLFFISSPHSFFFYLLPPLFCFFYWLFSLSLSFPFTSSFSLNWLTLLVSIHSFIYILFLIIFLYNSSPSFFLSLFFSSLFFSHSFAFLDHHSLALTNNKLFFLLVTHK